MEANDLIAEYVYWNVYSGDAQSSQLEKGFKQKRDTSLNSDVYSQDEVSVQVLDKALSGELAYQNFSSILDFLGSVADLPVPYLAPLKIPNQVLTGIKTARDINRKIRDYKLATWGNLTPQFSPDRFGYSVGSTASIQN